MPLPPYHSPGPLEPERTNPAVGPPVAALGRYGKARPAAAVANAAELAAGASGRIQSPIRGRPMSMPDPAGTATAAIDPAHAAKSGQRQLDVGMVAAGGALGVGESSWRR